MEMIFALLLFAAAVALRGHSPFPAAIFCFAVAAYGAGRWYLESLRHEETGGRDKTVLRVTSIFLAIAALSGLALAWRVVVR